MAAVRDLAMAEMIRWPSNAEALVTFAGDGEHASGWPRARTRHTGGLFFVVGQPGVLCPVQRLAQHIRTRLGGRTAVAAAAER